MTKDIGGRGIYDHKQHTRTKAPPYHERGTQDAFKHRVPPDRMVMVIVGAPEVTP